MLQPSRPPPGAQRLAPGHAVGWGYGRRVTAPRDVVVVLLDSLNRHMLGAYGGTEFDTPNLDRLAARSVRFTNHHTGSLPCMPARHDLLVGALDFPWRPWGSIEIWEDAITTLLRQQAGVSTMLASDHPHLFETGGENYHVDFGAWDYLRGHEDDPWRTRPDPSWIGAPALPARRPAWERGYDVSRTWFRDEADFPGPKTMAAAAAWLDGELSADARAARAGAPRRRRVRPARALRHARAVGEPLRPRLGRRAAHLAAVRPRARSSRGSPSARASTSAASTAPSCSMIDHWLGRILDVVDQHDAWDTTAFVLCTDHGHYLGEHGFWGKPQVAVHPELGHIPLLVSWPGVAPTTSGALTTTVDLHATLCDVFGVTPEHRTHGRSLVPLLEGDRRRRCASGRCAACGAARCTSPTPPAPSPRRRWTTNRPLSMFSNRWSTMPIRALPGLPDAAPRRPRRGSTAPPAPTCR